MTSLVEFLRARLDELEQHAKGSGRVAWLTYRNADGSMHHTTVAAAAGDEWVVDGQIATGWTSAEVIYDERDVLAEVDAKRRIVARAEFVGAAGRPSAGPASTTITDGGYRVLDEVLRLLALPYADHADYREEWKP